jgi:hypothetical protein
MSGMIVVNTKQLKFLNEQAIKKEFNRALNDEAIARLNRFQKHLLRCVMEYHENYAGKVSVRVLVHTQLVGEDKSEDIALLDISPAHWKQVCEKSNQWKRAMGHEVKQNYIPVQSNAPSTD